MCLILFAWRAHEAFPLILAANRDEFYERPAAPADFWEESPDLLAGRDLKSGGTWLGVTRQGRVAAITNYRDPASLKPGAPSRGEVVSGFLRGREGSEAYLDGLAPVAGRYNGFSLLLGDLSGLFVYSNRGARLAVEPGVHGISNHLIDSPWPKVVRGKAALAGLLGEAEGPSPEVLLDLLADRSRPPDRELPDTGVGLEWERILSSLFIESPSYGTRCSTAMIVGKTGEATFVERLFQGGTPWMTSRFNFRIPMRSGIELEGASVHVAS